MIVVWKPKSRNMLLQRFVNALLIFGKFLEVQNRSVFNALVTTEDYGTHALKCHIAYILSTSVVKVVVEACAERVSSLS